MDEVEQAGASMPPKPTGKRFVFIDALRGLAALAVVLFHSGEGHHIDALIEKMPAAIRAIIQHGELGVQVFFVLSGFVIAHSMARRDVTGGYIGRFMLRRSIRLDPPFWASMALVVAFGVLSSHVIDGKSYEVPSIGDVLMHMAYLPVLFERPLINYVYWTLCLEIQFYLVFAIMMWVVTLLRPRVGTQAAFYVLMIPATCIADLWALRLGLFEVEGLFTGHWYFFMAGVLVWNAARNPGDRCATPLAVLNIIVLGAAGFVFDDPALGVGAAACAAILAVGKMGTLETSLRWAPLQFLGTISYSLYLVHNPITGAAFHVGYAITGRNIWLEGLWFLLVIAICIFAGWLSYVAIERPSMQWSRKVSLAKKKPSQ